MTSEPAVRCNGLRYRFGRTAAVDGVDLRVEPGTVFGLLGPNGAGKTTTIRMISTLLRVPTGAVEIFGVDVNLHKLAVRRLIGYVPQQLSADSALTGRENVALFARLFDVPRAQRRSAVETALRAVGLEEVAGRTASTYSGGLIRRLELAQALVSEPRLLVLDEPTVGLDPVARAGVWEHIERMRATTGMTVLITTHYMEEADRRCDRVAFMHRGRIRSEGAPQELRAAVGPEATLEDAFRAVTGGTLAGDAGEGMRQVRAARRDARRGG
ncbi:ATP-binding cassette domain-containing protein [Saccharopolyspora sp. NPDC049357]|uniref:ABC transporter ATP-binding protein n=1 Tax=Saccharopolyspora sp. NPDC049357 TaxID=3154507 RepID=UPI00343B1B4C